MSLIKQSLVLHFFVLCWVLSLSTALTCRFCKTGDPSCVSAEDAGYRECENDNDICYSWFYRTGSDLGVHRDCISLSSPTYTSIKTVLGNGTNGCLKRAHGTYCFSFCTTDLCN